jgi:hypothetical protein
MPMPPMILRTIPILEGGRPSPPVKWNEEISEAVLSARGVDRKIYQRFPKRPI